MLDLAKTAADEKYKIRAMRGYIRLVRQFVLPDDQRVQMCRTALETAERDAEKKLVLEVMRRYPSAQMLKLAMETAKIPGLKDEAAGHFAGHRPADWRLRRITSARSCPRSATAR